MKIILNFLPVRKGGGLQNVLSFIEVLSSEPDKNREFIAIVRNGSEVHKKCIEAGLQHKTVNNSTIGRLGFEIFCRSSFSKGQSCFTFFGPPMIRSKGYLVNIVGCAYSNLFYPEIDFWGYLPFIKKLKAEFIDLYRKYVTACGDYWIFETAILAKRAVKVCNFPSDRVAVVKMTPSNLVSPEKVDLNLKTSFDNRIPKGFRFLFLSGAHPNKRQHLLPSLANELLKFTNNFCFVTTMDLKSDYARKIAKDVQVKKLQEHFFNIGPVGPEEVASLIDVCDSLCCFSVLESFSNNFVEAWKMRKPLLVTNADWAIGSCEESAVYINPNDISDAAKKMFNLSFDKNLQNKLIEFGIKQLASYPNSSEKNMQYYECIEKATRLGRCFGENIKWPRENEK